MTARLGAWVPAILLGAACLALAALVLREVALLSETPTLEVPVAEAATLDVAPAAEPGFSAPARESLAEIVERPIFSPSRRPAAPAAVAETAAAPTDLLLRGIVVSPAGRFALVQASNAAEIVTVAEGGEVSGWTAVIIDRDRALFRREGVEQELTLRYDEPAPPMATGGLPFPSPPGEVTPAAAPELPEAASPEAPSPD